MAGFLSEDQVRQVKDSTDLVQLIGEYVPVQRAGSNFKACCPFHSERTPSFQIYTDAPQHYHCYGCGAHGDAITFVRAKENLEFTEAMEFLARRAGIELEFSGGEEARKKRGHRDQLIAAHEWATARYEEILWRDEEAADARRYLVDRGFSEEVCQRFRLGWAPGRSRLLQLARRDRIDDRLLAELDLAVDRNGRLTDRFFERLMFPISDRFGNPVAFSGRLLPEAERAAKEAGRGVGKYINSTDTPLYRKGQIVFNLHRARGFCRDAGRIVVMEGPTDVMAADQAGMGECVAVLGTALTTDHARQLSNAIGDRGEVTLLFDGDNAGRTNSLKAVRTFLAVGRPTQVAVVPGGQDPAEMLRGAGRSAFEDTLASRRGDLDHLLATLAPRPHLLEQRDLLAVIDQVLDALRPIADPDLRDGYIATAARYLGVDEARLLRRLKRGDEEAAERAPSQAESDGEVTSVPALNRLEDGVLHCLVRAPQVRDLAFDELGIEPSMFPEPWRAVVDVLIERPEADFDAIRLHPTIQPHHALGEALFRYMRENTTHQTPLDQPEAVLRDLASEMSGRQYRTRDRKAIEFELRQAEESGDFERARSLFLELQTLQHAQTRD